jgi:hypothetical protein
VENLQKYLIQNKEANKMCVEVAIFVMMRDWFVIKRGLLFFYKKKWKKKKLGRGRRGRLFGYNLKTINGY